MATQLAVVDEQIGERSPLLEAMYAAIEDACVTPGEIADWIIERHSDSALMKLMKPHLHTILKDYIRGRAGLVGSSPSGFAGIRADYRQVSTDSMDVGSGRLDAVIFVSAEYGDVLASDLTTDHMLVIAARMRKIALTYTETADRYERWADEMSKAGCATYGELWAKGGGR